MTRQPGSMVHIIDHRPMIRTVKRWPILLCLKPWYDDPEQAAAMLMVAGMTWSGVPLETRQSRDGHIKVQEIMLKHRERRGVA